MFNRTVLWALCSRKMISRIWKLPFSVCRVKSKHSAHQNTEFDKRSVWKEKHMRKKPLGWTWAFHWQLTGLFDHQQNQRWHLKKKEFPWKRFSGKNRVRFCNPRKSQVFKSNHYLLARGRQCWIIRTLLSCLGVWVNDSNCYYSKGITWLASGPHTFSPAECWLTLCRNVITCLPQLFKWLFSFFPPALGASPPWVSVCSLKMLKQIHWLVVCWGVQGIPGIIITHT